MKQKDIFKYANSKKTLKSEVLMTEIDEIIYKKFDYDFDGVTTFDVPLIPELPKDFSIGLICGSSGSGKTSILKQFGAEEELQWNPDQSVASHFDSVEDAIEKLSAVGLNTVPTWAKPRHVLSNGEGFRADLARRLKSNCVIDEFTSVVNRDVAKSCSTALSKYVKKKKLKNIILATCHYDIIEWLQPDWVFDTDTLDISRGCLCRPEIQIKIYQCTKDYWGMFAKHHYLTSEIPPIVRCYLATWDDVIVGFSSSISLPGKIPPLYDGDNRNKYRECRTVVLPDFQGFGIGTRLSDKIADMHIEEGYRYFSKTSHIRMGEYRQKSDLWRATATNLKDRSKSQKRPKSEVWHHMALETKRICYSHEYIGKDKKSYDPKWCKDDDRTAQQFLDL
tara:strand:+ start:869 stop:2044 length:1176 start_codon:yes stop_codon:yes gene_type:complete